MYRIIKIDGTELGITDSVNYIRYGDNGCFTPATREDAIGVAFKSVAYNLVGHEDIEGAGMVKASADTVNYDLDMDKISDLIDSLCDMSKIVNGTSNTAR